LKKLIGGERTVLMIISTLTDLIHPFYGSTVLSVAVLISLFFVLSYRKGFKIFIVIIAALAISGALFLDFYYLRATENFSNYLFKFGFLQGVEVIIILFAAINILVFLAIRNFNDKNLIKIIVVLLFSLICMNMFIVASNFLMIFSSLVLTILCIFQILTLLDGTSTLKSFSRYSIKNYTIRFFMVTVFSLLLILVGFSLIFGATDFKNFTQIIESGKIQVTIIAAGVLLIFSSIYFLLPLFPFQNAYLKLGRRCEGSSLLVVWFLYIPVGIFLLLKVYEPLMYFMEKNNQAVSILFIIISALSIIGGNLGALRSKSLRRIFLFLFLSMIGMSALAFAQKSLGLMETERTLWLVVANLVSGIIFYFPAFAIFYEIEGHTGSDLLNGIRGFSRTHRYFGVNLIILLISFAGMIGTSGYFTKVFYIQPYLSFLNGTTTGYSGSMMLIVISGIIAITGILFIAANVVRVIVVLLQKPEQQGEIYQFPKFYYPYVLIFTLLALGIGIVGILGFNGISPVLDNYNIINIF
jgi:NADH:ubiquinone oxidoreductase subunit 2 (subunit N)